MIQRIQSIWLLLAATAVLFGLKLTFYTAFLPDQTYHSINGMDQFWLSATTIATGLVALIAIFLFKNRTVQLRLTLLALVLELILIAIYFKATSGYEKGEFAVTSLLQLAAIVFLLLASRGINKDEKMVKESDRLR